MRVAVVSDIHGNRTAFDAVLADLRRNSPDLILHGGDLADSGSDGAYIIDRVRDLGWPGVAGNTDEMLFRPESLTEFAAASPALKGMFDTIEEMASFTRAVLGEERLSWLRDLPPVQVQPPLVLTHAAPGTAWRAPSPEASDDELLSVYRPLAARLAVYGHIHRPYVRAVNGMTVANCGSVGMPHDGDPRAAYLLVDDGMPAIQRVEYDVNREIDAVAASGMPHSEWVGRILLSAAPRMP
jgi:predicted phosphodiesterase